MEKKGQQILVVKKLIKKKENASRANSTISSKSKLLAVGQIYHICLCDESLFLDKQKSSKINEKSAGSHVTGGVRPEQNRILLREVRKMNKQFQ